MNIDQIELIIRRDWGGAWYMLFKEVEGGHLFYPSGHVLTPTAYDEIRRRFGANARETSQVLSREERKKNLVRAKAHEADSFDR